MLGYAARRLLASLPVLLGITVAVFVLMNVIPGDPVAAMLWESAADEATAERLREQLGLNDPWPVRYGRFLLGALRGDFGTSVASGRPVIDELLIHLPSTLQLAGAALVLSTVAGVALGVLTALNYGRWADQFVMLLTLVGVSMPIFWSGLLLILLFAVMLGWLPVTSGGEGLRGLILPALALALGPTALLTRLVRAGMLEVLRQDYIVAARARGLRERVVIFRHALRNALIPLITVVGLEIGGLLSGTVVTETVFTRPGVGTLILNGIRARDIEMVQAAVLFTAVIYVLVNVLVDICYTLVDPRLEPESL